MLKTEFLKLNRIDPVRPIINNLGIPWKIVAYLNKQEVVEDLEQQPLLIKEQESAQSFTEVVAHSKHGEAKLTERKLVDVPAASTRKLKNFYRRFKFAVRFALTFSLIFSVLFAASNLPAVKQIIAYKIDEYSGQLTDDPTRQILRDIQDTQQENVSSDLHSSEIQSVEQAMYDAKKEVLNFSAYNINPPDNRIVIPRINKNIPIQKLDNVENLLNQNWEALEKQIQDKLLHGAVIYPGTVEPGYIGNSTITAHSSYYPWANPKDYIDAFALLPQMKVGDNITIFYAGNKYVYQVYDIFEVEPNETNVLEQSDEKAEITLITCTPIGTTLRRLIVKAQQISPDPEFNQEPSQKEALIRASHLQS
ncbi:MAG: sortase [Candidatus Gracilibacteria bacterium]|nr:sortase [Candidatus Gracilibacteria bacterium]